MLAFYARVKIFAIQHGKKGKRERNKRFTTREKQHRARADIKKETERKGAEFSCEFFLRPLSAFTLRSAAKTKPEGSRDRGRDREALRARSLTRPLPAETSSFHKYLNGTAVFQQASRYNLLSFAARNQLTLTAVAASGASDAFSLSLLTSLAPLPPLDRLLAALPASRAENINDLIVRNIITTFKIP